jgi:hypothetical protein
MEAVSYDGLLYESMVGVVVTVVGGAQEKRKPFALVTPEKVVVLQEVEGFENGFYIIFLQIFPQESFFGFSQQVLEPDRVLFQIIPGGIRRLE